MFQRLRKPGPQRRRALQIGAMLENVWRFGDDVQKLKAQGHLCGGNSEGNNQHKKVDAAQKGIILAWSDLGVSHQDGGRSVAIRWQFDLKSVREWHDNQHDA